MLSAMKVMTPDWLHRRMKREFIQPAGAERVIGAARDKVRLILSSLCPRCAPAKKDQAPLDPERVYAEFFGIAFHYYIAGRYAVFAKLYHVAGNLLHHAVEISLKGALAKGGKSLSELERFRHDLRKLWKAFKKQTGDPSLNEFDPAVSALHRHEKLRYPDFVLAHGMQLLISLKKSTPTTTSGRPEPKFELSLEAVDEIFATVFDSTGLNAKFFTNSLSDEAKERLAWENSSKII